MGCGGWGCGVGLKAARAEARTVLRCGRGRRGCRYGRKRAAGWSGAKNATQGFKIGGMVGFLVWFGLDLIIHGNSTVSTTILPLVDGLLEIVRTGIGGAVIAAVLGRSEEA